MSAADKPDPKNNAQWLEQLDGASYQVTRLGATERPFSGELLYEVRAGIYRCICCQSELFDANAKFDAGCGWPSFDKSIDLGSIRYLRDSSLLMERVEVRCSNCDAHLGHVFDDGPSESKQRYCINSVALTFEALDKSAES
ncbi:peptide-methionine (R)-S-oxide reductase [Alginatibacterium sediminis]|uniref:Peptide methionine sulfoxide reductase MsrB n=1 Tax=Alginatibacterium sediminis TaxID=2164068 RepID=A0A420EFV6_9ALTE|nr:peptide-methionine (R)-S-oxide reductase MsrB [Alginatibacterium sediminis]RKF19589.1 peptide-methionine (R)-S-oxide reductase [Alginatibacterium sediminis]